ncbi:PAS domain S-box protein [Halostella sp. JP-L12]|uniref:bacterio-opsin activator domain-containing protein n=1 Tax=Halostella TaxID=1843185 RepID=UPI0013CECB57|nr:MULTISPECIES: bacterio-opsin activator domain-containing protein [Halostella]NHN47294.1 PAS domain S-box protein [Halostella sp. JP-L12]
MSLGPGDDAADALADELPDATIETAADGAAVEARVAEGDVDCVVSAHDPPDVDAMAVLDRLREALPTLPFVLFADDPPGSTVRELYDRRATTLVRRDGDSGYAALGAEVSKHVAPSVPENLPRNAEHVYRALESSDQGIGLLDADGEFVYVNEAYADIYGYDREEMVGEHWSMLYREEDVERVEEEILPQVDEAGRWRGETVGVRSDDEEFVEDHTLAHTTDGGLVCMVRDVTDRKHLQSELDEALGRITDAFYSLDRGWQFTYLNDRAEALLDRDADEVIGETVWDEFPDIRDTEIGEKYREAMECQEPVRFESFYEPLDAWFRIHAYPSETGLSVYFEDVTEAVRTRRELEMEKERFRRMVEDVQDYAIFMLDPEGNVRSWNAGAEQIKGYEEEEIVGEHFSTFYTEEAVDDGVPEHNLAEAAREGRTTHEGWRVRKDGTRFWGFVTITALYDDGDLQGFTKVTRDMTERKRREEQLTELNDLSRDLLEAETADEISDLAVTAARSILDCPVISVALYDADAGDLKPVAQTPEAADATEGGIVIDNGRRIEWKAFVESETKRWGEPDDAAFEGSPSNGCVVPLGRHGVLAVGSTAADGLGESTVDVAEVLASTVTAALDRTEREREVREHEQSLEEKNEALERLNRINEVIRSIDRALVGATTRAEIEEAVCAELADASPYCFAWIGATSGATNEVRPRQWAGADQGYLDGVDHVAAGPDAEQSPAVRAMRTRETQAEPSLLTDPPFEPWRQEALSREFRSAISIPLEYAGSLYGVLSVCADDTGVFDEMEQAVLTELGDTIAHAINAVESKKALVSDSVVELEFRLRDPDLVLARAVSEGGGRFEFEGVVPDEGHGRLFFTVSGMDPEAVAEHVDPTPEIDDLRLVAERGDRYLYEMALTDRSLVRTLIDHGAVPREITADGDEVRLVVDLSEDADVRGFAEMMQSRYQDVELVGRRERERPVQTRDSFLAEVSDRLTARQEEVLRTAYLSGFFETPRDRTGGEIAESLGVSQPTFNNHLRAAQRKLFTLLFEGEA